MPTCHPISRSPHGNAPLALKRPEIPLTRHWCASTTNARQYLLNVHNSGYKHPGSSTLHSGESEELNRRPWRSNRPKQACKTEASNQTLNHICIVKTTLIFVRFGADSVEHEIVFAQFRYRIASKPIDAERTLVLRSCSCRIPIWRRVLQNMPWSAMAHLVAELLGKPTLVTQQLLLSARHDAGTWQTGSVVKLPWRDVCQLHCSWYSAVVTVTCLVRTPSNG